MGLTSPWFGLVVLVGLVAGWVAVQSAWRQTFPDSGGELDALAGRGGCGGCKGSECTNQCDDGGATRPDGVGRQVR